MATQAVIDQLNSTIEQYRTVDREKLIRKSLGVASLDEKLTPKLDALERDIDFAVRYAHATHDSYVNHLTKMLNAIVQQITAQAQHNNQEYIANTEGFLSQINGQLEAIRQHWAHFVTAAVIDRGFLEDEGIKKEYEATVASLQSAADETIEKIKNEANASIEEAKQLAEEIENRARKTATKISVAEAQEQFKNAQKPLKAQIIIWGLLSAAMLVAIFLLIYSFLKIELPKEWDWQILYFSAVRLTALAVVSSIAAYCMKIFKSQLHMYQHNLHRRHVTNSIEAFVESAVTPEQRDLILAHLVDAVATFGNSGLLDTNSDHVYSPKMTIDNITRSFSSPTKE